MTRTRASETDPLHPRADPLLSPTAMAIGAEAAGVGLWHWDFKTGIVRLGVGSNGHRHRPAGDRDPRTIADVLDGVHPDDLPVVRAGMDRLRAGEDLDIEFRVFNDGDVHWRLDRGRAERDGAGRAIGAIVASIDITQRKRQAVAARLLIRELDHRVKNNLATIATLAEMIFTSGASVEACRASFQGRIQALSLVHEALAASEWCGVALHDLITAVISPYAPDLSALVTGAALHIQLPAQIAEPLALALQELALHSVADGAWSVPGGTVSISVEPAMLTTELRWSESHTAADTPPGRRDGNDLAMLRGLVEHQLRGRIDVSVEPPGRTITLRWANPFQTEPEIVLGSSAVPPL